MGKMRRKEYRSNGMYPLEGREQHEHQVDEQYTTVGKKMSGP